ncbi:MAG: dihydroorotate dehydrogenase electron transfer subunit [bacterium]
MFVIDSVVSKHTSVQKNIFILTFKSSKIASAAKPGQFIHLNIKNSGSILRRPFSIYAVSGSIVSIAYQVVGNVTAKMSLLQKGDWLSAVGPIGNNFTQKKTIAPVFIAGGMGIASLHFLKNSIKPGILFFGARSKKYIWGAAEFKRAGWKINIATEDGSQGAKGLVTDLFETYIKENRQHAHTRVYVCGPAGLIKKAACLCTSNHIPGEASLENIMACGVGVCQGCAVEVKSMDARYKRVCVDGPVFDFKNLIS